MRQTEVKDDGNWDPPAQDRQHFRDKAVGNLGWLVKRGGKEGIKLDRPMEDIFIPLQRDEKGEPIGWTEEIKPRLLGPGQVAQVAFEAYKKLCFYTGKQNRAKMEWLSMSEEARISFVANGPRDATPLEKKLHRAIVLALKDET